MSLNAYYWLSVRDPVWDFVPYGMDTDIMVTISKPPDIDPELYKRPFRYGFLDSKEIYHIFFQLMWEFSSYRNDAWLGIGFILSFGLALNSFPYFLIKKYESTRASQICIFCLWCFFVPVFAYYKGAMKMFLNSDFSLPFDNLDQVLNEFPEWNLIHVKGYEDFFKTLAAQVIKQFIRGSYIIGKCL